MQLKHGIFDEGSVSDTGTQDAWVMKTVVRLNKNNAGVYGTVVQTGTIRVGDPVSLVLDARR